MQHQLGILALDVWIIPVVLAQLGLDRIHGRPARKLLLRRVAMAAPLAGKVDRNKERRKGVHEVVCKAWRDWDPQGAAKSAPPLSGIGRIARVALTGWIASDRRICFLRIALGRIGICGMRVGGIGCDTLRIGGCG